MTFLRNIKRGVQNLWYWFPVIWKDRNWDYCFLYDILIHKLRSMEKSFRSDAYTSNADETANQVKACADLFEKLRQNDYLSVRLEPHEEKWGTLDWHWNEDTEKKGFERLRGFSFSNVQTEAEQEQAREEFRIACNKSDADLELDLYHAFGFMKDYIREWWD